jgi:hypothetical protein
VTAPRVRFDTLAVGDEFSLTDGGARVGAVHTKTGDREARAPKGYTWPVLAGTPVVRAAKEAA